MSDFEVNLVTPRGPVAQTEIGAVIAPGELGEFEVLPGHVPFLSELHPGVLSLGDKKVTRSETLYAVSKGFLEVEPSGAVQILVERAVEATEVDTDAARAELDEVEPLIRAWKGELDGEYRTLVDRRAWAQAQLDAAARV